MFEGKRVTFSRREDGIAVLAFGNPPRGTMDPEMEAELERALDAADAAPDLRVVVATGRDAGVFVRHYDVGVLEKSARAMQARGLTFSPARPVPETAIHRVLRRIEESGRIWIAAINGTAMGGGCELALACDLRVAEDGDYRIGLPETNIALLPGAGGTQRLARLVGPGRALEWILMGRVFAPAEAAAAGLVSECCTQPALDRAMEIARGLAAKSPRALAHVKRLVRGAGGARESLAAGLAEERTLFCDLMVDEASIETMARMNAGALAIEGAWR